MQARYESRFEKLEKQRAALFERVASLEAELLSRSPGEGEWSVAQVATHLAGAERRSLEYIRKKTQDPSRLWSAGLGAAARSLALTAALRSPLRFSVPPSVPEPAEHADWDVARREWDEVRADWRSFLADFPGELAGQAGFKHPRAGYQTMTQALRFMREHVHHHAKQVDRILARIT